MMGVSSVQGTHKGHPYRGWDTSPRPAGWIPVSGHGNDGLKGRDGFRLGGRNDG